MCSAYPEKVRKKETYKIRKKIEERKRKQGRGKKKRNFS